MKYNVKITNKKTDKTTFAFYAAVDETQIQSYLWKYDREENQDTFSFEVIEVDLLNG